MLQPLGAAPRWLADRCAPVAPDTKEALKRMASGDREALLSQLREEVANDARVQSSLARHAPDFAMLTWDEVRRGAIPAVDLWRTHGHAPHRLAVA
ncbi:MAG: hypothetical protein IPP20_06115 [Gemmatimonadetes bacterium]|nr:hypothetical protein [Gemmatimonadota bacterium]